MDLPALLGGRKEGRGLTNKKEIDWLCCSCVAKDGSRDDGVCVADERCVDSLSF